MRVGGVFEPIIKPIIRTWWRFSRGMTLGVRVWIENDQGQVCLVRHTYVEGLMFPGGGVERGETVQLSAQRECEEEVGVQVTGGFDLRGVFKHRTYSTDHVVFFKVKAGEWRTCASDHAGEISEICWVDPHNLPSDVSPATRRRFEEQAGARQDTHW